MLPFVLLILLGIANGQPPPGIEMADMAGNMEKFGQIYGIATQLMSMGTDFMRNSGSGNSVGGGSAQSSYGSRSDYGGNSVLGEVARPAYRGVPNYGGDNAMRSMMNAAASEYGGLPTGGRPQGGIQSLLNTFLGSSVGGGNTGDSEPLPPPPPPKQRPPQQRTLLDLFGMGVTTTEEPTTTPPPPPPRQPNFLEMFGLIQTTPPPPPTTTTRRPTILENFFGLPSNGGQQMSPQQPGPSPRRQNNLLDFFGSSLGEAEDPNTSRRRPQRNIIESFLGAAPAAQAEKPRQAPIVDVLEMFGLMETTTTTQRPKLFDTRSGFGLGTKGASDIDGILNALMRGGVRPVQPEQPSAQGILSQFFGKKR